MGHGDKIQTGTNRETNKDIALHLELLSNGHLGAMEYYIGCNGILLLGVKAPPGLANVG